MSFRISNLAGSTETPTATPDFWAGPAGQARECHQGQRRGGSCPWRLATQEGLR
jgi:hypothetical protein